MPKIRPAVINHDRLVRDFGRLVEATTITRKRAASKRIANKRKR